MKHKRLWGLVASGTWANVIKDVYDKTQRELVTLDYSECNSEISLCINNKQSIITTVMALESFTQHCDYQRNNERQFAQLLGLYLADCVAKGQLDGLVVIASPRTLGDLRRVCATQVSLRIVKQICQSCILKNESDVLDYFDSYCQPLAQRLKRKNHT